MRLSRARPRGPLGKTTLERRLARRSSSHHRRDDTLMRACSTGKIRLVMGGPHRAHLQKRWTTVASMLAWVADLSACHWAIVASVPMCEVCKTTAGDVSVVCAVSVLASISDGGHRIFSRLAPSHATAVSSPSPTAGGHLHSTTAAGRTPSPSFFYSHRNQGILPLPLSLLSVRDVLYVRDISSSRGLGFVTDSTGDFIPPSSEFEQQHLLQIWSAQQTSIPALLPSSGPDLASHSSTFSSTAVFKFDQQFFNRSVRPKNICRLLNRQPQLPHRALIEKRPDASSTDGEDDPLHFSVHKQGVALGRSVDLTKFDGYDQLIDELDQLFEFKGELMAPNTNWMIVFTDNEDDMMLVGDDPWQEFCAMVRQIFIYPKEEVQKMDSSILNPKNEDCPNMKENVKETKGSLVKILKKYDKRTGALIRQPFIEKVLQ
ncbi:hypothetical protein ZIOFF_073093 [Zingiber officinale]|uniref:Auxin-responsive protein n=1 Tax=Zingiber officinale TaxID=94328 RepID=A0A8J5BVM4_ZINOF|nr:hypothetical protein ZIOFF_073093 [Zingiber officinale]